MVEFEKVGIVRVDCYVRTESRPDARGEDRGTVGFRPGTNDYFQGPSITG